MTNVEQVTLPALTRTQHFSGAGLAILRSHSGSKTDEVNDSSCSFTHLSSTFPLKLISPRTSSRDATLRIARQSPQSVSKAVAALYVVGYGGGLVSGDKVSIDFDVGQHCTMLILTQGSTKVFKVRGYKHMMKDFPAATTSQTFRCIIRPKATLIVLPDPVTCFANSKYRQIQRFDLRCSQTSSLVLLDWFTPGRQHLASKSGMTALKELWEFDLYESRNEIRRGSQVIAREVATLERNSTTSIAEKCGHFTCFATLFLIGVDVIETIERIKSDFYQIQQGSKQQHQQRVTLPTQDPLIWSCTSLEENKQENQSKEQQASTAIVVRVAGVSTELVRAWFRDNLLPLKGLVGDDLYRQALGS